MHTHMGLLVACVAPPKVPCRRSWGTWPLAVHSDGAMEVHIRLPATCGAPQAHMGHMVHP